jgi:hypothetical protein
VAREVTDYLFEEFTSIPLITMFHEVAVNPKVVGGEELARSTGWPDHSLRSDQGGAVGHQP